MNQVYSGNYQYHEPSYSYQPTSQSAQWSNYSSCRPTSPNCNYNNNQMYGSCGYNSSKSNHCMGSCNPSKLYAETYSYLTENLMKPVIEEVYHDLKSITATNTVANNSMATKMGLQQSQNQEKNMGNIRNQPNNYGQSMNGVNQAQMVQNGNPSRMSLDHRQSMSGGMKTQGYNMQNMNAASSHVGYQRQTANY